MSGFDSVLGYVPKTFEELVEDALVNYEAETGVVIDRTQPSPQLFLARAIARMMKGAWDGDAGTYSSGAIGTATGAALRNKLYPFIGPPLGDVSSTVTLPLTGAGEVSANSTVRLVADGTGGTNWILQAPVILPGDGLFAYADPGPKSAIAGSTWTITSGPGGWLTAGPNVADASLGRIEETEAEYRQRFKLSIIGKAIAKEVLKVEGVTAVSIFENEGDIPDAYWGETHWVEVLVQGGTDADVAAAIRRANKFSTRTLGNTTVMVTEANYEPGGEVAVRFSRPTLVDVWVALTITKGEDYSQDTSASAITAREDAIKTQVVTWGNQRRVGLDAWGQQIAAQAMATPSVPGIATVFPHLVGLADPPLAISITAGVRDLLVFAAARIALTGV
jgi:hypothetical protein